MNNLYRTTSSLNPDAHSAVNEIKQSLGHHNKLILFFASSNYNAEQLAKNFHKAFPNTTVVGCSTSGEIITGKMLDNSIVAMAFDDLSLKDFKVEIVLGVKENPLGIKSAFKRLESYFGQSLQGMSYRDYVGIVLTDGLSGSEELVMDQIGNATDVTFIGGSTGDDLKFKETTIYYNDHIYNDGTLLLLLKPKEKFSILKTQSFKPSGKKLLVTKGNEQERQVIEFNNKPAAQAYAEALGVTVEALDKKMFYSPLALMAGDDPFVRSPRVIEGTNVNFFCSVKEGMELMVLESTDIIKDTAKALRDKEMESGKISGIINFNCILRTLDLKQQNKTDEYGKLFDNVPTIGFSTYGESYIGHINQTATMLVFHN